MPSYIGERRGKTWRSMGLHMGAQRATSDARGGMLQSRVASDSVERTRMGSSGRALFWRGCPSNVVAIHYNGGHAAEGTR
jgi:hypothetical protein